MPKTVMRTEGERWDALRAELGRMLDLARSATADLHEVGKALARIGEATHAVFEASGERSVRMAAVRKALDLRTPRSELEAFVERARS